MKITKKHILGILREILKERETITIPAPTRTPAPTKTPTPEKRPNPLMPPKEAPKPAPKALYTEDEITDKIVQRFKKLNESKHKAPKMQSLLQEIIAEASIEQLQQQFVDTGKITQEVFDEILKVTKSKGAYATWLVKKVQEGIIANEDIYKYEDYLKIFDRYKREFPSSDINAYRTKEDVEGFVTKAVEIQERDVEYTGAATGNAANLVSAKGIAELKAVGIDFIGIVDGYQVFEVPTKLRGNDQAYAVYKKHLANCAGRDQGAKIQICTMANISHFNNYLMNGPYYVFFNLNDPKSPYQFHYESNQFMDKNDIPVAKLNPQR